jgi:hypothetical protein
MFPFFVNGEYFRKTCDNLFKVLQDSTWNSGDEDKIRSTSGSLIVELILKGYGLKSIREFPRNIFKAESNKSAIFPKSLYPEEDAFAESDSLSVADRLGSFARHYFKKPIDYIVIFEMEGLKGDAELEIGEVTFYSPNVRSFFAATEDETTKFYKEQEFFGKKGGSDYFANCAVKLSFVDSEIGVIRAAEIAEKSLDLLRCKYRSNCKFSVLRNQHFLLKSDGTWQSSSHGVGDDCGPIKHMHSIEIKYLLEDDESIGNLNNLAKAFLRPKERQSPIERKVYDCVHWLRKGEEAERMEDRLLHYWIAIEKIFTFPSTSRVILHDPKKEESKIFLIRELLSSCIAYGFIYHVGWTLRDYLKRLLGHPMFRQAQADPLTLPQEVISKCLLEDFPGKTIILKEFIESVDLIKPHTDKKLILQRIDYVKRFYNDGSFAKTEIINSMDQAKQDLLLIYRYRNSIVHNAHYDSNLLKPFVEKASLFARLAVSMLVDSRKDEIESVEKTFVSKHLDVGRILARLEKGLSADVLGVPAWNASKP